MPSKQELMASSLPASAASKIGVEALTSFTAAGTTQTTATALTANFANVTTSSINAGVIIGAPFERTFVYNSGPNALTVYPPVGGTFVGLALNAGATVASGSGLAVEGDGVNFVASVTGP